MASRNHIWVLMGRKISGSITLKEEQELDTLLREDPEACYVYEILKAEWKLEDVPEEFVDEIKVLFQPDEKGSPVEETDISSGRKRAATPSKIVLIPVLTVVLLLFTWLGYYYQQEKKQAGNFAGTYQNVIIAPNGSQTQVVLSDGTKIRLNSASKLSYPKNFNSMPQREVYLEGEAYFEIIHDEKRPFIIQTPTMKIKDLGTVFNVKAYPGDAAAEAVLIEGIIEVSFNKGAAAKTILMQPNEKIEVYNNTGHSHIKDQDEDGLGLTGREVYKLSEVVSDPETKELVETAWINNKLIFKNEVFGELVKDLERKYNVRITIENEELKNYKLTGAFRDESLEQALKVLQLIAPFNYSIEYDKVSIY